MKIQEKVLKFVYYESVLMGCLPIKYDKKLKCLKISQFLFKYLTLWLILATFTTIYFIKVQCENLLNDDLNESVIKFGILGYAIYSIISFYVVFKNIEKIVLHLNRIFSFIHYNDVKNCLSNRVICEVFVTNFVVTLMDFFIFRSEKYESERSDFKFIIFVISSYPRKVISLQLICFLEILYEILKVVNRRDLNIETKNEILVETMKILMIVDNFVQFLLIINSVVVPRNAYALCSHLIMKALNTQTNNTNNSDVYLFIYLPPIIIRIYVIVNRCCSIRCEVNLIYFYINYNYIDKLFISCKLTKIAKYCSKQHHVVSILVKHFEEKISLIKNDNRIFLMVN